MSTRLSRLSAVRWFCLFALLFFNTSPVFAEEAAPGTEMPSEIPHGQFTLGVRAAEDEFEGFGDVLVPVWLAKSGLWFVAPRASITDNDEEETNIGVGYRHLFPEKKIIVGANVYYDARWTENDNRFDQVGFGLELLTDWIDARANYYLPEDDKELIDTRETSTTTSQSSSSTDRSASSSVQYGAPYGRQNSVLQDEATRTTVTTTTRSTTTRTTVTQIFQQYEEALEGWDAEIGLRLPIPVKLGEARVFGGYYSFDGDFTDTIDGFKGRLELRVLPALILDAEYYDSKDLRGYDYVLGGRLTMPFDLAELSHGRNPFAGARAGFDVSSERAFVARLAEMVIRDPHVLTEVSEYTEVIEERTITTSSSTKTSSKSQSFFTAQTLTLAGDVTFVDGLNGNDANSGTFEEPKLTLDGGVNPAIPAQVRDTVFVWHVPFDYDENVTVARDVTLIGEGEPMGYGGMTLGGGLYPVVDGNGAPTFTVQGGVGGANNVSMAGFELKGGDTLPCGGPSPATPDIPGASVVYVSDMPNFDFHNNIVHSGYIGLGAEYTDMPTFNLSVLNNRFDRLGVGALVDIVNSDGGVQVQYNSFERCGLGVGLGTYDPGGARSVVDAIISHNTFGGGGAVPGLCTIEELFGVVGPIPALPASLPSMGAIALLTEGKTELNADIFNNTIRSNLLGITAVALEGSTPHLNLSIHDNVIDGGGSQQAWEAYDAFDPGALPDLVYTSDMSLAAITVVGVGKTKINNLRIYNNQISDHFLGVGLSANFGTKMTNCSVYGNQMTETFVGIAGVGIGDGTKMQAMNIFNNTIVGGGSIMPIELGYLALDSYLGGTLGPIPPDLDLPNGGAAGILLVGADQAKMGRAHIYNNDIFDQGLAIGAGVMSDAGMNNLEINHNALAGNLMGVLAMGGSAGSHMKNMNIHDNFILGGGASAIAELMDTNFPEMGLAGITVVGLEDINMKDGKVNDNVVMNHLQGISLIGAYAGVNMDGYEISGNMLVNMGGILALAEGLDTDLQHLNIHDNLIMGFGITPILDILSDYLGITVPTGMDVPAAAGVVLLGLNDSKMGGAKINDNLIYHTALGVGLGTLYDAGMDNVEVGNNVINGSLLGILAVSEGIDSHMKKLNIHDNTIRGSGLGLVAELAGTNFPNMGIAGVLIAGINDANMKEGRVVDNTIENNLLGVGVLGFSGANMNGWEVSSNSIGDMIGILALAEGTDTRMKSLDIHHNRITGEALVPTVNMLEELVYLGLPSLGLPEMNLPTDIGAAGILVGGIGDVSMRNASIYNNTIQNNALGVGVYMDGSANMDDSDIHDNVIGDAVGIVVYADGLGTSVQDLEIYNNQISGEFGGSILAYVEEALDVGMPVDVGSDAVGIGGILVGAFDNANMNGLSIRDNTIDNMGLGIGVMADANAQMQNAQIISNDINGSLMGIGVLANDGGRINVDIKANTIDVIPANDYGDLANMAFTNILDSFPVVPPGFPLPQPPFAVMAWGEDNALSSFTISENAMAGHNAAIIATSLNGEDVTISNNTSDANNYFYDPILPSDLTDSGDNLVGGVATPVITVP